VVPARVLVLLAALLLAAACAPGGGEATPTFDPTGPLQALPPCQTPPPAADADVDGIVLPEGAVITEVTPQGPVTQVTGFAPLTPVQIEVAIQEREDLEILQLENEIFEAEGLVSNGTHRTYLKATAICDRGSQFIAVVAAEVSAQALPSPTGTASP
jgi:hypothetical protein